MGMGENSSRRRSSPDLEKLPVVTQDTSPDEFISPLQRVTSNPFSQGARKFSFGNQHAHKDSLASLDDNLTLKRSKTPWMRPSLTSNGSPGTSSDKDKTEERQQKLRLLEALFGLSEDEVKSDIWPGAPVYLRFVCEQLQVLFCGVEHPALAALGYPGPASLLDLLQFTTTVTKLLKSQTRDGASISEIFDSVVEEYKVDPDSDAISSNARQAGQQLIFAIIGWLTMLYKPVKPKPNDAGFYLHVDEKQAGVRAHLANDVAKRPIAGLLRGLGNILPQPDQRLGQTTNSSLDQQSVHIQISALNFYALKTIAKINIQWVDTLSAHLEFHPLSRTLLVFRFPSFCALNCKSDEDELCFNRILDEYYYDAKSINKSSLILATYKREVLLSYRLLFGQTPRARKLFTAQESRSAGGENNKYFDPLLDRLCRQKASELRTLPNEIWPYSCRAPDGSLLEQDVYSTETDFPMLGQRLLRLQAFSLRQSPSRMRDMWRDRRNPVQWLTLWAVLLVGGISLILQVVQIILSAAQLASQLQC